MGKTYQLFTSYLWQTTSTVVSTDERIYLFDPAYFPQEIDGIFDYVQSVREGRELVLVLTHGDWDHIAGYPKFPDAKLIAQKEILESGRLEKKLNKVKQFDGSYYVVTDGAVEEIIPGHGIPAIGREDILHRIHRDRQYLSEARAIIFEGLASGVEEKELEERFGRMMYDDQPIDPHLLSEHEQNRNQLIKEAVARKG